MSAWRFPLAIASAYVAICAASRSDGHDDGSDHAEETEHFREDENENEGHKYRLIDRIELDALLADDTDSVPCGHIAQACQCTCEEVEHRFGCSLIANSNDFLGEENRNDESVDGENTSHNDWDDRLEGEVRPGDGKRGNTHTALRSAIGRAQVAESHGESDAAPRKPVEA